MAKTTVAQAMKNLSLKVSKRSPEILTGIGIAGMIVTSVLAVQATPKALRLIELRKEELEVDQLTGKETVKAAWKCYIPAAATCVVSSACLIGASSVNLRRNTALAAAYTLSDTALREYREKVVETLGEKKEQAVREKIAEDHIKNDPVSAKEIIITGKGNTRCYDMHSGRYFTSDIDLIKRAVNELNRQLVLDMYVSLNDFYDLLGLSHSDLGYDLGWNIDCGLVEVEFSSHLSEDKVPCLAMKYSVAPKYGYSDFL